MAKDLFPSTHPLTPPLTEEVWLDWIRLLRSRRVGVSTFFRLMNEFGSAAKALEALPEIAAEAGVKDYRTCPHDLAQTEWLAGQQSGARPVAYGSPDYPSLLAGISDPPPFLWVQGQSALLQSRMIALVGARNASSLGLRMARKLARDLGAAGFTVVSGLARGIDTAVHAAALDTGTVAVLAGGVDVVYPPENAVLTQEIEDAGLKLSEQPMSLPPTARHFPRRNRIVSGLCEGVVVIEAAAKSGSLITARAALDQGREVLAVPGHPFDGRAFGCNMLIRDGAALVRSAQDVIEALERPAPLDKAAGSEKIADPPRPKIEIRALHQQILARIGSAPVPEDQIIRDIDAPAADISPQIVALELEGRIRREAGGLLSLAT